MYAELLEAFSGDSWAVERDGDKVSIVPSTLAAIPRETQPHVSWDVLVMKFSSRYESLGHLQSLLMPLAYNRGSEVLNSAVQGLDPYLKDGQSYCYRQGVLTQPVVRFSAAESASAELEVGFLTSFVNLSRVGPVVSAAEYARASREGTDVLVEILGGNADVHLAGTLAGWRREEVHGFTLRIYVGKIELGDFVYVASNRYPHRAAFDMGASLERLRWVITGREWGESTFGTSLSTASLSALDAFRTSILLVGCGIDVSARGAGSVTRRSVQRMAHFGLCDVTSKRVNETREVWDVAGIWMRPSHEIAARISRELIERGAKM